jgi:membrane protease YdiL (CAAX protease family)
MLPASAEPWRRLDRRASGAILLCPVVLTLQHYFGDQPFFRAAFPALEGEWPPLLWWAGARVLGFFVIPILMVIACGDRPSDYGLGIGQTRRRLRAYLACALVVLPLTIVASRDAAFAGTYPFLREAASARALVAWELIYGSTFVALEFFFRGYALFSLERAIGIYAPLVLAIPYAMIHFGKPLPEALGSLVAGVVLGALALATRSIWGGVALHLAVAWTMDLLALYYKK